MATTAARKSRALVRVAATQNIKILLTIHRMTQVELARVLGFPNRQYLNALVTGRRSVSPDNVLAHRIAKYFDESIDALFPLLDLGEIAISSSTPLRQTNHYKSTDTCQENSDRTGDIRPKKTGREVVSHDHIKRAKPKKEKR